MPNVRDRLIWPQSPPRLIMSVMTSQQSKQSAQFDIRMGRASQIRLNHASKVRGLRSGNPDASSPLIVIALEC